MLTKTVSGSYVDYILEHESHVDNV